MNKIGNKYEITMFEWYEILAKTQKKLDESIECNRRFGDNEEWVIEDTEKLNKMKLGFRILYEANLIMV